MVRRSFEALNRRDIDAILECFAHDCVFDGSRVMEGTYTGKDAFRRLMESVFDSLGDFTHTDISFLSEGERVVALANVVVAGTMSGAISGGRLGYLYELRDGLIVRQEVHPDGESLLASLGFDR